MLGWSINYVMCMQGYVIYSVKQKLKQEFIGLPGSEIKQLKLSGVEVCLAWWLWSSN